MSKAMKKKGGILSWWSRAVNSDLTGHMYKVGRGIFLLLFPQKPLPRPPQHIHLENPFKYFG